MAFSFYGYLGDILFLLSIFYFLWSPRWRSPFMFILLLYSIVWMMVARCINSNLSDYANSLNFINLLVTFPERRSPVPIRSALSKNRKSTSPHRRARTTAWSISTIFASRATYGYAHSLGMCILYPKPVQSRWCLYTYIGGSERRIVFEQCHESEPTKLLVSHQASRIQSALLYST